MSADQLAAKYGITHEWMTDRNGRDLIAVQWADVVGLLKRLEQVDA